MPDTAVFPSLVVFGPLTFLPSTADRLDNIRQRLREWQHSGPIITALQNLERTWYHLQESASDPSIVDSRGLVASKLLSSSLTDPEFASELSTEQQAWNAVIVPLGVLTHVLHYLGHLIQKEFNHEDLAEAVRETGGFQGCCGGLLSALAIAAAKDEEDIARTAAWAVQLAFAVGCWIDADYAEQKRKHSDTATLVIRWNTAQVNADAVKEQVEKYDGAYVAIVLDQNTVTVIVPNRSRDELTAALSSLGVAVKQCGIDGRYHTQDHAHVIQAIRKALPASIEAPHASLPRSNATGLFIDDADLSRAVLRCIIAQKVEWYSTITAAASSLSSDKCEWILMIGHNAIPPEMNKRHKVVSQDVRQAIPGLGTRHPRNHHYPDHSVAVVGMACRLPGANSPEELWELLVGRESMLRPMPEDRFDPNDEHPRAPDGMKFWGNFLDDIKGFDHRFFNKKPREAVSMDPQQRILLEVAYEALQSAAYFSALPFDRRERSIGCYIGACSTDYDANIASHPPTAYSTTGVIRAFLSGKISHHFGFSGPAITLDTACSSSAVAIHAACQALQTRDISAALAGGATINAIPYHYENLAAAQFLSPTGATKSFDVAGDGYCRGEGVGLVVLKRLDDAVRDGDHIHGVIVGSAINQGNNCVPITVPHSGSQAQLYTSALNKSALEAKALTFVEAHGTGTPVGDPVELEGIREVFGGHDRAAPLYVGSVKGNIGHLEGASGVAGLIKALLQMRNRAVPPQASFKTLNTRVPALEPDRMCIPVKTVALGEGPITACVNNYGAAGSNAALMLAEGPAAQPQQDRCALPTSFPIHLTAASPESLRRYGSRFLAWLKGNTNVDSRVADVALSLARHTDHSLPYSLDLTVSDMSDLVRQFSDTKTMAASITKRRDAPPLVLCFGGQTSDRVGLDRSLGEMPGPFRSHLDRCDAILRAQGHPSIYPAIFQDAPIADVVVLHAALFAVQYASAMSWLASGLHVDAVIGHSFGQLTAWVVCGSLQVEEGLRLVAGRAALLQSHWGPERGFMMAIDASEARVRELFDDENEACWEIACYNGPSSQVVVCDGASAARLQQRLEAASTSWKNLRVPYGFHSRFTDPLLDALYELAASLSWQSPTLALEMCTADDEVEDVEKAPTPADIVRHTRGPVHFAAAANRLRGRLGECTWLEAGSGSGIISMLRRSAAGSDDESSSSSSFLSQQLIRDATKAVASTTSALWSRGYAVNCWFYHASTHAHHSILHVPTYSWDHSPHWLKLSKPGPQQAATPIHDRPEKQLLTPLSTSGHNGVHCFAVSMDSDEYAALTQGFDFQSPLPAPATISLEILAAALTKLEVNVTDASPECVAINAPPIDWLACQDLLLSLEPVPGGWGFTFASSGESDRGTYAHGVVKTCPVNSTVHADLARYQRLVPVTIADDVASNCKSDRLQGRILYSLFSKIGVYPSQCQLVQSVTVLGNTVVGECSAPTVPAFRPMQRIECFLQIPAIHANCLQHDIEQSTRYRLASIESMKWGRVHDWTVDSSRGWKVVCSLTTSHATLSYDCFVYDLATGHLHVFILGAQFHRQDVAGSAPQRLQALDVVEQTPSATRPPPQDTPQKTTNADTSPPSEDKATSAEACRVGRKQSIYHDLCGLLEQLADVPREDIGWDATFDDLGVDSLLMMEAIRDVGLMFHIDLPTCDLEHLTDTKSMVDYLAGRGCAGSTYTEPTGDDAKNWEVGADSSSETTTAVTSDDGSDLVDSVSASTSTGISDDEQHYVEKPYKMMGAAQIFESVRGEVQSYIEDAGFADFWRRVYPTQRRLVLAYTAECFQALGCDLKNLSLGSPVPALAVPQKYSRLLDRLYDILADGGIVRPGSAGSNRKEYIRTSKRLDGTDSRALYFQMLQAFPEHADETELLHVTGCCLADCITERVDALTLLFGKQAHRDLLAKNYDRSPMAQATTSLLAEFLRRTLQPFQSDNAPTRKAQILEIGAGTGGTARYVVDFLTKNNIEFDYTFTDISPALVSQAKKKFKQYSNMHFGTWDCNEGPPSEYRSRFDVVISTNCIHATRDAQQTSGNILPTLTENGVFCLVEFTCSMYWFDLVYGLLDGWWVFDDGRKHAMADETFWSRALQDAGFKHVSWTDGNSAEARTMRLIIATKENYVSSSVPARPVAEKRAGILMQQTQWLRRAGVDLYADIYLPKAPDLREVKRPIALLFHGGGHLLFGRKDIPMKHVRELLKRGYLPISVDYRLCPEVGLYEGPYMDCCAALRWAREELAHIHLAESVTPDASKIIAIGWSSGGQLAMSLGFTGPQQGIKPPEAVFALYSPTDLEHEHWDAPCCPEAAEEDPQEVDDVLSGVHDYHITEYTPTNIRKTPSLSLTLADPRARIVLHLNWKAQSLRTLLRGLPSKTQLAHSDDMHLSDHDHWKYMPALSASEVREVSPLAHVRDNSYKIPTFMVHGTRDDWIPTSMSVGTRDELKKRNVPVELVIAEQCGHAFDLFPEEDPLGVGWRAIEKGYDWIGEILSGLETS